MRLNKKAVTETTSFIFLTLLIVTMSLIAYYVLIDVLNDKVSDYDRNNVETYLKRLDVATQTLYNFDNSSTSFSISFKTGSLIFEGNRAIYQSLISYSDTFPVCFGSMCYYSVGGFERMSLNLSSNYVFENNFSLVPGDYNLLLVNLKNGKKIRVFIR